MAKAKLKTIDEAWLGLDSIEADMFNPMSIMNVNEDDFNTRLAWLMTRPEYLSFLTHHVLNIQLLPSQSLVLNEIWERKFPMLIASRGLANLLCFPYTLYSEL